MIFSLFFVLYTIGDMVMKWKPAGKVFAVMSGLTFPMFLVQNRIGSGLVRGFEPTTTLGVWKTIIATVVLCAGYAWCVKIIANGIVNAQWYKKAERLLLKKIGGK